MLQVSGIEGAWPFDPCLEWLGPRRRAWASIVQDAAEGSGFNLAYEAGISDSAEEDDIDSALWLVYIAVIVIAVYSPIALSNCRGGCAGLRIALSIGGACHSAQPLPASANVLCHVAMLLSLCRRPCDSCRGCSAVCHGPFGAL